MVSDKEKKDTDLVWWIFLEQNSLVEYIKCEMEDSEDLQKYQTQRE